MDGQPTRIERELHIEAPPELVFRYLTDSDKLVQWMGRNATAEARPGGALRIDYNGFDIMRGNFVEVVPSTRVVFTWGWETLGDAMRPGASTVEFDLSHDGAGTRLKMVHSGLTAAEAEHHGMGWDRFLPELVRVSEGGAPAEAPTLTRAEEYASQLNVLLIQTRDFVESCNVAAWALRTGDGDGRSVGVVAAHIARHLGLVGFVASVVKGERSPFADVTGEALAAMNAQAASEQANVTPTEVVAALQGEGPKAVEALHALSDEQLAKSQPMAFAGGAELSAEQLILGPLLGDVRGHLEAIRVAAG